MKLMYLFWGLLLILFNLGLGWVDVILDFAGYGILIYGLIQLAPVNTHLMRAKNVAMLSTAMYLLTIIGPASFASVMTPSSIGILAIVIALISSGLQLFLLYSILYGLAESASQSGDYSITDHAKKLWRYYWITLVLNLGNSMLVLMNMEAAAYLAIVFMVASIIVSVMILKLIYDARALRV